jgi:hypothetical protein
VRPRPDCDGVGTSGDARLVEAVSSRLLIWLNRSIDRLVSIDQLPVRRRATSMPMRSAKRDLWDGPEFQGVDVRFHWSSRSGMLAVDASGQMGVAVRGFAAGECQRSRALHGHALSVHKAQRVSVDRAHVLAGERSRREWSYVAASRAREETWERTFGANKKPRISGASGLDRRSVPGSILQIGGCAHMSMPPMPPIPPPPWECSSFGNSATMASVVRIRPATDAAFCSAQRATLVGSTTPISMRSPYWAV